MNVIECDAWSDLKTINLFIKLVRKRYGFDMIDVNEYSPIENYPPIRGDEPDVQILYSNMFDTPHFICVYYDPTYQTVYTYDSQMTNKHYYSPLEYHIEIKKKRYPMAKSVDVLPTTEQYDETSSGPLAIAYATTLIQGDSPANVAYKMSAKNSDAAVYLRQHIYEMLRNKELSPFPR